MIGLVYTTARSRNRRLTAVTCEEWETIVKKLLQQYGNYVYYELCSGKVEFV